MQKTERPRARDAGLVIGILPTGPLNSITDVEATEEAVYNSPFRATTTTGRGRTVEASPIDRTLVILRNMAPSLLLPGLVRHG